VMVALFAYEVDDLLLGPRGPELQDPPHPKPAASRGS